ncbi:MAG: fatty acid desaturase [Thermocrispum sp.]
MSASVDQRPVLSEAESRAVRRGVPDPGIPVPVVSLPTLLLFAGSLALWSFATWLALGSEVTPWVTIPIHAAVTFTMFTVLHEATHHAAGRLTWVNEVLGRLSMPFVASFASFPAMRHIHIEHHRNTNEHRSIDPDAWTSHGPAWQLPFRWATQDLYYIRFWAPRFFRRPRAETIETAAYAVGTIALIVWAWMGGWVWQLAVVYLIPQRIGITVLAWWFDWLPHHGLTETQVQNRFRATRVRVGLEWLLTPVLLYQNYHLVHHLHPAIPFYRYVQAWKLNEATYLDRDSAIMTAWGTELTAGEYRAWRKLTDSFQSDTAAEPDVSPLGVIHKLRVSEVRPLTEESVAISFEVPETLREQFRFTPGQHLTLQVDIDGVIYRRTYSICAAATSDLLRIGVKRIPGGVVSGYLTERVRVGDRIGVQAPAGHFTLDPCSDNARRYVGIVAGSGITPIISMLSTALLVEEHSRFTLVYGNRTPETTMFADDLRMLERQFEGRLRVVHQLDGLAESEIEELHGAQVAPEDARLATASMHAGPIDPDLLAELVGDVAGVDGWYLCGPQPLVRAVRAGLLGDGVGADRLHVELFHPENAAPRRHATRDNPTTVTATLRRKQTTFEVDGSQSVLDAALDSSVDAPYACMGGACGTCRAKLLTGTVEMEQNLVLTEQDLGEGYILTCQSYPTADRIDIDYDA